MTTGGTEEDTYAEVVATAQFTTVVEVDGGMYISAKVLSLYPHCQQCTTPWKSRRNYLMDREYGGSGYIIVPFPTTDLLFQPTQLPLDYSDQQLDQNSWSHNDGTEWSAYEGMVQHLHQVGIEGDHGGTKIDNHTADFNGTYRYDERYYIELDNIADDPDLVAKYHIDGAKYVARHGILQSRISLWYANTMNLPTEFGNFADIRLTKCPDHTIGNYNIDKYGPKNEHHLKLAVPTLLFGGKEGDGVDCDDYGYSHQPIHKDFCDTEDSYSVSTNPRLSGRGKPGSLMIPLSSTGRDILIGGFLIHVHFGQAIFFLGDCPHAGASIPASHDDQECHPSLHLYVVSDHHDVDINDFQLDVDLIGMIQPHLFNMLTPSNASEQCSVLAKRLSVGCKSTRSNPKYKKEELMRLLDEVIKQLTTMKQQVKEDIQQGGTKQGKEVEEMETQRVVGVTTRAKKRQNTQTE